MKKLGAFIIFICISFHGFSLDPASDFARANGFYQKQSYDSAALLYERIIAESYFSGEVFYNLGNCYYKTGKTAKAILNYERALKYNPGDEDILFNLKVAQLKTVDKIETMPQVFYVRWINAAAAMLTADGWARVTTACVWILFFFAGLYVVSSRRDTRRAAFILAACCFFILMGTWFLGRQRFFTNDVNKSAVVMSVSAYVKSSPGDNNTDLFLLHEGTKVSLTDEYENWVKIRVANGSVGWMKKADVEEI